MLITFNDNEAAGGGPAVQRIFGSLRTPTMVHIQVFGANTLRIAQSRDLLMNPPPGASLLNGFQITQADGIKSIWWIGEMWGIGSAPNTLAEIEAMPCPGN